MEDGDREAAAAAVTAVLNGAEDVVKAAAEEGGDQGDLAASGDSPAVEGGSEDTAPVAPAAAAAAAVSKEEEPADSQAPATKVLGAAVARGIPVPLRRGRCLGGDPLLIKMVLFRRRVDPGPPAGRGRPRRITARRPPPLAQRRRRSPVPSRRAPPSRLEDHPAPGRRLLPRR
jgi:hypothetical protein